MPSAPVDYHRTSARPAFAALPAAVREAVAALAGASVASARPPVGSGFTGSYAGVLALADGRRVFAKAAGPTMPHVVRGLRREGQVLPILASLSCVPHLVGAADVEVDGAGTWVVLVLEHIDGRQPGMPWTDADARAAHDACLEVVNLDPAQMAKLGLSRVADDVAADWGVLGLFAQFRSGVRAWPAAVTTPTDTQLVELDALVAGVPRALAGDALCHNDVRPDNILISGDQAIVVDWNWVRASPPWFDFVGLWPQMAWSGIDLAQFADSPLLAGADPEDIDSFLAAIVAYMFDDLDATPPPGCTPALRAHQRWQGELFLEFLARRRGWR